MTFGSRRRSLQSSSGNAVSDSDLIRQLTSQISGLSEEAISLTWADPNTVRVEIRVLDPDVVALSSISRPAVADEGDGDSCGFANWLR